MKVKVYISYQERRSGGEPLSNKRWSSRKDTIIDFQLKEASLQEPSSWYKESFEIECQKLPKTIYVVLVRYKDGDTFGNSYGHGYIEGVYLSEDRAQKVVEAIREDTYVGEGATKKSRGYIPWNGYFNRLESVNYHPMVIRKYPTVE
jgi:hypothetical protein